MRRDTVHVDFGSRIIDVDPAYGSGPYLLVAIIFRKIIGKENEILKGPPVIYRTCSAED